MSGEDTKVWFGNQTNTIMPIEYSTQNRRGVNRAAQFMINLMLTIFWPNGVIRQPT